VPTAGLLLGQVIKHHAGRRLVSITRRVVRGTTAAITAVLQATGTGTGINTAYIERLNATFRGALSPLARRSRAIARDADALTGYPVTLGRRKLLRSHAVRRIHRRRSTPRCVSPTPPT
jgi:hypothetical protein